MKAIVTPTYEPAFDVAQSRREVGIFRDTMRMLRRHKLLLVTVFMAVLTTGIAIAVMLPPRYSASSSVMV